MEPADAFDSDDMTFLQQKCGCFYGCFFINETAFFVYQPNVWAADGTGVGLGVKAPVGRIFVFFCTIRTQRKISHRRIFAVVGNGFNNGKARSAVGAVGKRVVVATVSWVK